MKETLMKLVGIRKSFFHLLLHLLFLLLHLHLLFHSSLCFDCGSFVSHSPLLYLFSTCTLLFLSSPSPRTFSLSFNSLFLTQLALPCLTTSLFSSILSPMYELLTFRLVLFAFFGLYIFLFFNCYNMLLLLRILLSFHL